MTRLALVLALLCGLPLAARAASPPPCPMADDVASGDTPLQHLAALLRPGATLYVLAIGSGPAPALPTVAPAAPAAPKAGSVTAGPVKAAPPRASATAAPAVTPASPTFLPAQAARALEEAVRGLHVNVTALGRRGLTAAELLDPLRAELPKKHYGLVLWQTGTVDAVANVPPEAFYEALAEGADAVNEAGADLVLIDPQFSRFLEANANLEPYDAVLQATSALPGVVLFHRFDIMREWASIGAIDLERTAKADRPAAAARLHACLGQELARMLLRDAGPAPRARP